MFQWKPQFSVVLVFVLLVAIAAVAAFGFSGAGLSWGR